MTTRAPLPPVPNIEALARTGRPVLAAVAAQLAGPRPAVAMYEDSPYITPRQEQQ